MGLGVALALLAGCQRAPERDATSAASPGRLVTFNKDIAPILFENCATCHRPIDSTPQANADPICVGGAPFPLLDYASVQPRARQIAEATRTRAMPPWLPEAGHGEFAGTRRLRDDQRTAAILLIAITGWGQDEDRRRAFDAGFDAHITKPADIRELLALIDAPLRLTPAVPVRG